MSDVLGGVTGNVKQKLKDIKRAKTTKNPNGRKNPKAFSVANVVRTKRTQQRNLDRAQKKELIPQINRAAEEELPPPPLVVVMGPQGVGKSTLIRSLVKIYTGQNITDTVGPITVVAGRKRRITLFECPLDIYSMTDLAKVADLVLLMIDASYGFEMETFEFLNQLQLHGFPKVMGVLTNLDKFRASKTLQNTKKALKHRFWTEIYKGAKVFEFMGVVNGKYRKHEVKRLALYVSRVKFRPLVWRNTHPYVLVDRVEDVTPIQQQHTGARGAEGAGGSGATKDVTLYGYVRGSHLKPSQLLHLIGAGDFSISGMSSLPDPCPLPGGGGDGGGAGGSTGGGRGVSTLKSRKDSLLYAPMANVGRVTMDRDGLYIELKTVNYSRRDQLYLADAAGAIAAMDKSLGDPAAAGGGADGLTPAQLLRSMQDVKVGLDQQLEQQKGNGRGSTGSGIGTGAGGARAGAGGASGALSLFSAAQGDQQTDWAYGEEEDEKEEGKDEDGYSSTPSSDGEENDNDDSDGDDDDDDMSNHHDGEEESDDGSDNDESTDGDSEDEAEGGGSGCEGGEERGRERAATRKLMRQALGASGERQSGGDESERSGSESGPNALRVMRGGERGGAGMDLMRAVYGADWAVDSAAGDTDKEPGPSHNEGEENEEDDEEDLFALPEQRLLQGSSKALQQRRRYIVNNALDSSRTWTAGEPEPLLLEFGAGRMSAPGQGRTSGSGNTAAGFGGLIAATSSSAAASGALRTVRERLEQQDEHGQQQRFTITASSYAAGEGAGTGAGAGADSMQAVTKDEDWWALMKTRFVTGGWKKKITAQGEGGAEGRGEEGGGEDSDDGEFDAFEDLQTGQVFNSNSGSGGGGGGGGGEDSDSGSEEDEEAVERRNKEIDRELRELNAARKANFKATFDRKYDNKELNEGESGGGDGSDADDDDDSDDSQGAERKKRKGKKGRGKKGGDGSDDEGAGGDGEEEVESEYLEAAKRQLEEQRERNKREFSGEGEAARLQHEGFRQGLYVRVLLKGVPAAFTANFRPHVPVVLGGLLPHESAMGFITARVKRHRWHKRILKSNDPLIFSIGWRRFQSIPVFTTSDQNERERYLKYTPEHMHCTATFYGPLVPPNTGILGFQKASNTTADFRISLTGIVLEQRATPQVTKKLKLVGTPVKIYKNSAFITGMFTSALEVAKFEHAKIKTVSGIRGSIKKALHDSNAVSSANGKGSLSAGSLARQPPGTFRATFEDKILMSDIVVCRLWVPVVPEEFYNPVLTLLHPASTPASTPAVSSNNSSEGRMEELPSGNEQQTAGDNMNNSSSNLSSSGGPLLMRTTAEMRRAQQVPQEVRSDSVYKPVVRTRREFAKLKVPAKLQEALPFAAKPKQLQPLKRTSYLARRAVVAEPGERKSAALLQELQTLRNRKTEKRRAAAAVRSAGKRKQREKEAERFADVNRETKRQRYREEGKEKAHKASKASKRK